MENTTTFYNRLPWLLFTLILIIFLLNISGIIALFIKSKKVLNQEKFKHIKKLILRLGCSSFGIILIISSCLGITEIPLMAYSYKNEIVSCLEFPIGDEYKFTIEDRRNGEREVYLEDYNHNQRYIWAITKFAIFDKYIIGETSLLLYDQDYFWFHLNSKEVFDTRPQTDLSSNRKKEVFLDSLSELGILELPEMTPVETLCNKNECIPCNDYILDP